MKLETRYAHHPEDVKGYDTEALRRHFLVEQVFAVGEISLVYSHVDRVVFGGAMPTVEALEREMVEAAGALEFERAAALRDEIRELRRSVDAGA